MIGIKIPFQKLEDRLIALLPNGKVEFLSEDALPHIHEWNNGINDQDLNFFNSYIKYDFNFKTKQFHLDAPIIAFIEITNLCNLRCKHCYAFSGHQRASEINTDEILALLDKFDEIGVLQVFLTGGEVFAHKDAVKIINHARTKKFTTQIFTNGILITEEILKQLTPGASFFLSFDTAIPEKTIRGGMDFPILKKCFDWMKRYGHYFRTAVSVHNYNVDNVEEIFDWCLQNQYPRPQWLETHPIGRALLHPNILLKPSEVERVFQVYKNCMDRFSVDEEGERLLGESSSAKEINSYTIDTIKFCQRLEAATQQEKCGRSVVYINSGGNAYPCSNCMSNSMYSAGNIKERDFLDIWHNEFKEFRKIGFEDFKSTCDSCEVFQKNIWCQFRCPPLAKNVSKNILGCGATEYVKRFILKTDSYWKQRAKDNIKLVLV